MQQVLVHLTQLQLLSLDQALVSVVRRLAVTQHLVQELLLLTAEGVKEVQGVGRGLVGCWWRVEGVY